MIRLCSVSDFIAQHVVGDWPIHPLKPSRIVRTLYVVNDDIYTSSPLVSLLFWILESIVGRHSGELQDDNKSWSCYRLPGRPEVVIDDNKSWICYRLHDNNFRTYFWTSQWTTELESHQAWYILQDTGIYCWTIELAKPLVDQETLKIQFTYQSAGSIVGLNNSC